MSYKCVVVTPAGRRQYLEILVKHLAKQKNDFEEWHLWKNTNNAQDIECMENLQKSYSWIKIIEVPNSNPSQGNLNIHRFFNLTRDIDTIYIRLDDDIVWLDKNFISDLYNARISNPGYFLVYPQIINNALIGHIQQRTGVLKYPEFIQYDVMGNGWKDPKISKSMHEQFLDCIEKNEVDTWRNCFKSWTAFTYERISINSIAFFGKTFANLSVGIDEEQWLSCDYPKISNTPNIVVGSPMCVHYAFFTQRDYLDKEPKILQRYLDIANNL